MKLSVIFKYSKSDLFSKKVRFLTFVLIAILFISAAISTFFRGFPEFIDYHRKKDLESRPGALTLHIKAPSLYEIEPAQYESFSKSLDVFKKEKFVTGIFKDIQVKLRVEIRNTNRWIDIYGKVLEENDVSLVGEELTTSGKKIEDINKLFGKVDSHSVGVIPIIAGKRLKSTLNFQSWEPFICQFEDGITKFSAQVLDELKHEQVDHHYFYIPKSFMDKVYKQSKENSRLYKGISFKGLPVTILRSREFANWATDEKELSRPYMRGIEDVVMEFSDSDYTKHCNKQAWDSILDELTRKFKIEDKFEISEYYETNMDGRNNSFSLDSYKIIHGIFVSVSSIDKLRLVEGAFYKWREEQINSELTKIMSNNQKIDMDKSKISLGFPRIDNPVMIRLVEEVENGTKSTREMVTYFLEGFLLILIITFGSLVFFRISQKSSEIGLLRMMGASDITIHLITILQTLLIGIPSIISGIFAGFLVYIVFLWSNGVDFFLVFNSEHQYLGYLINASFFCLLSMVLSSVFAGLFAISKSPGELINTH